MTTAADEAMNAHALKDLLAQRNDQLNIPLPRESGQYFSMDSLNRIELSFNYTCELMNGEELGLPPELLEKKATYTLGQLSKLGFEWPWSDMAQYFASHKLIPSFMIDKERAEDGTVPFRLRRQFSAEQYPIEYFQAMHPTLSRKTAEETKKRQKKNAKRNKQRRNAKKN
jgi:hypothetical protein